MSCCELEENGSRTHRFANMKILLVDDERGFLTVMGEVLRENGHDVILAENGKQAREALEFEHVDVIISDVFMPTLDGVRFHDYVREFTDAQDIPFIFMSGYDDEHTRNLVVDPSIDFFLSKTAPIEKVLSLIESLKTAKNAKSS
jgi:CheY-like chemotaxis protein